MSHTSKAVAIGGRKIWYELRCNIAEHLQTWALKAAPKGYCISCVELVVDRDREIAYLRHLFRVNGLRSGFTPAEIDSALALTRKPWTPVNMGTDALPQ